MTPSTQIDVALSKRKIIVTCGTGGVGKTTLSAALAFRAAIMGKRTVVVTIDPAKRLATSLGMKNLGDEPTDLTPQLKRAYEKAKESAEVKGSLHAIMPDTSRTFELFLQSISPTPEIAQRLRKNPIFQMFAKEFSGANEYMAMERLYALDKSGLYDCIILDTPPSRNTMAFLQAPKLLAQFFEERMIRWLVVPTNKLVSMGMKKALGILEKLTGEGFMTHLVDFAAGLFEVQKGFTSHLSRVTELLESSDVGFIMVTTPTPDTASEVRHFIETLAKHHLHFDGVAMNRTFSDLKIPENSEKEVGFQILRALQQREESVLSSLRQNSISLCARLPELARDVHSVEDLLYVALAFDSAH
jgi:anion-transporting  ArsA/GET3 family ATPase